MTQAQVSIKSEKPGQREDVHAVIKAAFKQDNEVELVKQLREAKTFIPELSMVAMVDDKIVGHAMLSPAFIEKADSERIEVLALAPVAVHPDYQNQGLGKKLVNSLLALTEVQFGDIYRGIIVLGDCAYYSKFGFVQASQFGVCAPFKCEEKNFMAMPISNNALANCQGEVVYPAAFSCV